MRTELKMFPNRTETGVWGVSPNLIIRKELFSIISHMSSGASLLNTFHPVEWPYLINRVIVSHPTNLLSLEIKKWLFQQSFIGYIAKPCQPWRI